MRSTFVGFLCLLALGGCNAILDIHEHDLAEGSAGKSSAGSGGQAGGSGGSAGMKAKGGSAGALTNGGSSGTGGSAGMQVGEGGVPSGGGGSAGSGNTPVCGNGKIDGDDACDDGNTKSGDGCSDSCEQEDGWTCDATGCNEICGDGLVVGAEAMAGGCDDGNPALGDGCSNCRVDTSYFCTGQPSSCAKTCGNGQVEGAEGCDDGNAMPGDGCHACAVETGYECDNAEYPSKCTDIDECAKKTDDCDANATCENEAGGFKCTCNDGYSGPGDQCDDVDECKGTNDCDANAQCANSDGSYACDCNDGFTGNGKQCDDVDECKGTNDCDANADCTNTTGSYDCKCKAGFSGSGTSCSDVDECSGTNNCSADAKCTNTPPGSYTCTCKPGFTGNGTTCTQNSCNGLSATCGKGGNESCCSTKPVPGGSNFYRSYNGQDYTDMSFPATISAFHLDRFEVTVSRFRKFVTAWRTNNWRPAEGDGKHSHLNGGSGLVDSSTSDGTYEHGWSPAWESNVTLTDYDLSCSVSAPNAQPTWQPSAGTAAQEKRAMNCVNWYEAYAFCIWDGGFLPSEAEWNFAASGGTDYRVDPWPNNSGLDCSHANYNPGSPCSTPFGPLAVGSTSTAGDGKYGQADLAGNVTEWTMDSSSNYSVPCINCASLEDDFLKECRGGWYNSESMYIESAARTTCQYTNHDTSMGVRCARP